MGESGVLGPPAVNTIPIPKTPNNTEAIIKILVVIFCIYKLYHRFELLDQFEHETALNLG